MKRIHLVAVLAVLGACGGWSKRDTLRELSFSTVTAADWYQTEFITADCNEINPIIGECGHGPLGVGTEMASAMVVHALVSAALPAGKYRQIWQYTTTGGEVLTVAHNYANGYTPGYESPGPMTATTSSGSITVQPHSAGAPQ